MKTKTTNAKTTKSNGTVTYNNTHFTQVQIDNMVNLGMTVNNWRQRNVWLLQHPNDPDMVVSIGITFDQSMKVISAEPKSAWATALDYISQGKVYTSH
jgi:hypothetical protein